MNALTSSHSSGSGTVLLGSLTPLAAKAEGYKGVPYVGTGIIEVVRWAKKNHLLTKDTLAAIIPELPGLFGGYPQDKGTEIGPDGLFIACFAILMIANLGMLVRNMMRKHNFYLQLGFAFFCCMKVVGYACRIAWAKDQSNIPLGVCSVVFIQVAQFVLLCQNLVLAHRVFTWRHPQTGYHWTIVWSINILYPVVSAIMVMAIIGQSLPYLYFLSEHHYNICMNVMKASAVLNLVYSTLPFQLIFLAYFIKPGTILKLPKVFNKETQTVEKVMPAVYQATWIKSAHLFYYPEHNAQMELYKGEPLDDAVRIIPSREPPKVEHRRIHEGETMHPLSPHFHWAMVTVIVSSFTLMMNTCFRVAACFHTSPYATLIGTSIWKVNFWPHHPYVMHIFYGATEVAVLAFLLLMRIDLRFYIPDTVREAKNMSDRHTLSAQENPVTWAGDLVDKNSITYTHDSGSA